MVAIITARNPHLDARLARIAPRKPRVDPALTAIIAERITAHNRPLAYVLSATIVFLLGFYAATQV